MASILNLFLFSSSSQLSLSADDLASYWVDWDHQIWAPPSSLLPPSKLSMSSFISFFSLGSEDEVAWLLTKMNPPVFLICSTPFTLKTLIHQASLPSPWAPHHHHPSLTDDTLLSSWKHAQISPILETSCLDSALLSYHSILLFPSLPKIQKKSFMRSLPSPPPSHSSALCNLSLIPPFNWNFSLQCHWSKTSGLNFFLFGPCSIWQCWVSDIAPIHSFSCLSDHPFCVSFNTSKSFCPIIVGILQVIILDNLLLSQFREYYIPAVCRRSWSSEGDTKMSASCF